MLVKKLALGILFSGAIMTAQTVKLNAILINSQNVTSETGPIDIGTANSSTVLSLIADVTLPTVPSDTNPGTIAIWYKVNSAFSAVTTNGGDPVQLLFLGGKNASRSFSISLTNATFSNSGGYIYAEYKTYSGIVYKSSNISIIKTTPPSGPNPAPPTSGNPNFEYVPYGGIPILPSLQSNSSYSTYEWLTSQYADEPNNVYSVNSPRGTTKTKIYRGDTFYIHTQYFENGILTSQNVDSPFILYVLEPIGKSISNYISAYDQFITSGSNPSILIGTQATYSLDGVYTSTPINNYQWQKRLLANPAYYDSYKWWIPDHKWEDIPGANQQNYTPPTNATASIAYRRIVIDNPSATFTAQKRVSSDVVTVYINQPLEQYTNTICCDFNSYGNGSISPITSATTNNLSSSYYYQWYSTISYVDGVYNWAEVVGENEASYTPKRPTTRFPNGRKSYYMRCIIRKDDFKCMASNVVVGTFYTASGKMSNQNNKDSVNDENISLYPNPVDNALTINWKGDQSYSIRITDLTGKTIFTKKNITNNYLLDTVSFESGIYNLTLENEKEMINRKIIKK